MCQDEIWLWKVDGGIITCAITLAASLQQIEDVICSSWEYSRFSVWSSGSYLVETISTVRTIRSAVFSSGSALWHLSFEVHVKSHFFHCKYKNKLLVCHVSEHTKCIISEIQDFCIHLTASRRLSLAVLSGARLPMSWSSVDSRPSSLHVYGIQSTRTYQNE